MWIIYALMTPIFWSAVHVMDSHCVDQVFEKSWMGVITSSITSLIVLLLVPLFFPFGEIDYLLTIPFYIFLAFAVGFFIQISQLFYFKSLEHSEAGIVAAYWNMTPAFLPIAGFIFLRDILSINEYLGIFILVLVSVSFYLIDANFQARRDTFFMMFFASVFQVLALSIEGVIFTKISYAAGFFLISFGLICAGLFPLIIPHVSRLFIKNAKKIKTSLHILFFIEILNLCALATSQKAISLGNPSLVAAVETSVPGYTFIASTLMIYIHPKFGDRDSLRHLYRKILLVLLMIFAVWLIEKG